MRTLRPQRRQPFASIAPGETITLATASGRALTVEARHPTGRIAAGTAILLHSSMASRRIWNSPREQGVVSMLTDCGIRTLALDFRGHGESGPAASKTSVWTFDDLVKEDLPALLGAARDRYPNDRITIVGHSLGAQVAIASTTTAQVEPDAIVALATNVWLPTQEENPLLRAKKGGFTRFCQLATRARGFFPARALGFGSDDEAAPFVANWTGWWQRDHWTNEDLSIDYMRAMSRLKVPVLSIASVGDSYRCTPSGAARFIQNAPAERVTFELVRRADDGGAAPDHMQLVTTRSAASVWQRVAAFCKS